MDITLPVVPEGFTVRIHKNRRDERVPNGVVWSIDKVGRNILERLSDAYAGRRRFVTEVRGGLADFEAEMQRVADEYFHRVAVQKLAAEIRSGR